MHLPSAIHRRRRGPTDAGTAAATLSAPESVLRRFARDPAAVVGAAVVAVFAVGAIGAPVIARNDPLDVDPVHPLQGVSWTHPMGTDNLGRDIFARILYGSRLSLGTAAVAAVLVLSVGVVIGLVSGLRGGWVDGLIMRVVDGLLAFPNLILALALAGTLGGGLPSVIVGLSGVWWASYARLVRGLVLELRERPFVEAAVATGAGPVRIAVRHILPSVVPPVVVLLSIEMGGLILAVSALSFLGIGAQPPAPEWGAMLNDGRRFLFSQPQLMLIPGAAIFLVVLGFNLMGDGLRDVLDPKGRSGRRV
ncbi:MAG TPA: nickel transporter permease [Candidatus Dormibacteraeota bacterium]|nr:nickel transporter permease [Candidatus Dormibacteraeota bacterium]